MRGGCRRAATDPLLPGRAIGRPCDGMVTVMSDSATGRVHRRVSSTLCHMAPKWEQLSYRVRTRLKLETFQAKGDRCWQCGAPATEPDHIIPVSAGGEHTVANLRPACRFHNRRRGNQPDPAYPGPSQDW
jgi:5-methylcytosine-specific restriction endonuclease McrA